MASPQGGAALRAGGSGAQARGLWRTVQLLCGVWSLPRIRCLPPLLHRRILDRRATRKRPFCSFLLSRLPLPHRLLIVFFKAWFSFIDTHSSKLTRHPVPGACARCAGYGASEDPAELVSTSPPPTPTPPPSGTSHHVIQLFSLAYVLVHSGCPNVSVTDGVAHKPQRLISHPSWRLGSKVRLSPWSGSAEGPLSSGWRLAGISLCPHPEQGKCDFFYSMSVFILMFLFSLNLHLVGVFKL